MRAAGALPLLALALLPFVVGFTVVRDPDTLAPVRWSGTTVTVVAQQDGSADVTDGSDLVAIEAAVEAWAAPCSALALVYGGTDASGADANDGTNRIAFRESGWPGGMNGAAATTVRRRDSGGSPDAWSDVDILLNGQQFQWATSGDPNRYDIQHIVTHEVGHLLGLQHSARPESSVYFGGQEGHLYGRTLHPDDVAGLCYLYPSGSFTCSSDEDCPLFDGVYGGADVRQRCDVGTGACVNGGADYGADCFTPGDCATGLCVDDPRNGNGADPGFCTQTCDLGAQDCPGGDLCSDAAGTPLCLPGRDDCLFDGDCGGANDVCPPDIDGRYRCRHLCLLDVHCDTGEQCHGGTGEQPPGFCRTPGAGAEGAACVTGYDCEGLACGGTSALPTCLAVLVDLEPDAGPDPEPEVAADAGPDPEPEMEADAGPDPEPEVEPDVAGPDAGLADGGGTPDPTPDVIPGAPGPGCRCVASSSPGWTPHWTAGWTPMLVLALGGVIAGRRRRRRGGVFLGWALLVGLGASACESSPSSPVAEPVDVEKARGEVTALLSRQAADWSAGDLEKFVSVYAEDAVFLSPSGLTRGRQAILDRYDRRYRKDGAEMGKLTLDVLDVRAGPSADHVSVALRWTLVFAQQPTATGLSLVALVRDGEAGPAGAERWRIEQDASM